MESQNSITQSRKRWLQLKDIWKRLKKNKAAMVGFFIIIVLVVCAIFAEQIAPYGYDDQVLSNRLLPPSSDYIFGTDAFGRDIFSRIIFGTRTSLKVGIIVVTISSIIGTLVGAVAGYYGNHVENVLMRMIDILLAIPPILLAISITTALGPGLTNVMIAIGIASVPGYARIVRASVISLKEQEFVEAARSVGCSDIRIIVRHILPNCLAPIIVQGTMRIAAAILASAGLSFLGLGIQPPIPEWGGMLSSGRSYIRDSWWVVTFPGLAIMSLVFAFNLFGDGLRDALDPRLKN